LTPTPTAVVREFLAAWNANDIPRVVACLHPEVVYHNMPVAPIHGRAAVARYLTSQGAFDWVDWKLLAIAADGNKVLTERIDDFGRGGIDISLPLMGIFEIDDGLITAWRDYFDMAMYQRQLTGTQE
jgi:limonene-1,2-epoxide hydrolase